MRLLFPKSDEGRIDPARIRDAYTAEMIVATISESSWPSEEAFHGEWRRRRCDWEHELGRALGLDEFQEVERSLLEDQSCGVVFFVHKDHGEEIALFARGLILDDQVLTNVALIYRIEDDHRVGLWHVPKGTRYFSQGECAYIRRPR